MAPGTFRNRLDREAHVRYLLKGLGTLSKGFTSLDASKPWICYWILHSLDLLDALPTEDVLEGYANARLARTIVCSFACRAGYWIPFCCVKMNLGALEVVLASFRTWPRPMPP